MLILNSPSNPTGGVLSHDDLAAIAEIASHHRFLIFSDEIYSRNIYGERFESITQFEELRDRIILVDGFSKAYAMTGWRLGYSIAPPAIGARRHRCLRTTRMPASRRSFRRPGSPR